MKYLQNNKPIDKPICLNPVSNFELVSPRDSIKLTGQFAHKPTAGKQDMLVEAEGLTNILDNSCLANKLICKHVTQLIIRTAAAHCVTDRWN